MSDVPPVPADDPGPPPAPRGPSSTWRAWTAGVIAASVLAAGVALVAGSRSGGGSGSGSGTNVTTSATAQSTVTAGPGWSRGDAEIVGALALTLEEASATKALSTATILAVERCTLPLAEAASQLDTVVAQRRAAINRVAALDGSGGFAVAAEVLGEALEFSLAADEARRRWVDWLAEAWSVTYESGCWPPGQTPTDANLEMAQSHIASAAAARTEFLTLFNPFAAAAGLRTWEASEF